MNPRHRIRTLAALLAVAPLFAGCDETVDVPVTIRGGAGVSAIEAVALPGPCPGATDLESPTVRDALGAELFTEAGVLPIDGDAASVAAWGISAGCEVIAFACEPLEGTDPIVVELEPIAAYDRCDGATCGGDGRCGGPVVDGGGDGSVDGGTADGGVFCESDEDCIETNVCDGTETCDLDTNTCVSMNPLDCDDGDPCTEDRCDAVMGCINDPEPFNMDGDAFTAEACGGTDCDDTDDTVFPGAEELCDSKNNDCDGAIDENAPLWYLDCDGDGFAADVSGAIRGCDEPAPDTDCDGGWTNLRPVGLENTDCEDSRADVNPDQTEYRSSPIMGDDFDYNCDLAENLQYSAGEPDFVQPCFDFGGTGSCTGTHYYVESSVSCGDPATLSRCAFTGLPGSCGRQQVSTTVACR